MNKSDLQILGYTVHIKLQIIFSLFFPQFFNVAYVGTGASISYATWGQ